jgi:hypothetical protein
MRSRDEFEPGPLVAAGWLVAAAGGLVGALAFAARLISRDTADAMLGLCFLAFVGPLVISYGLWRLRRLFF